MDNRLYDFSPIIRRPRLEWPDGARVAFWVGLNIEHYEMGQPSVSIEPATAQLVPDPLNYGWRDYGPRVGVWRMMDVLDKYGLRASVHSIPTSASTTRKSSRRGTSATGSGWRTGRRTRSLKPVCRSRKSAAI